MSTKKREGCLFLTLVKPKTWTYLGQVGMGNHGGTEGPAGTRRRQDGSPRRNSPFYAPGDGRMTSWVFSGSNNKGNPMQTDGRTKSVFHPRFIRCLSLGLKALFVLGCLPVDKGLFVYVHLFMLGMSGNLVATGGVEGAAICVPAVEGAA